MKKSLFVIPLLFASVLTGCGGNEEATPQESTQVAEESKEMISEDKAKEIALEHVEGTVQRVELDTDDDGTYFEVIIQTSNGYSEVYLDAYSGDLIRIDQENTLDDDDERENAIQEAPNNNRTSGDFIPQAEAEQIALSHVAGNVLRVELDTNDDTGVTYFEVYIQPDGGGESIEVYVNAKTGELIEIDR